MLSTDNSPHPQIHVEAVNGYPSDHSNRSSDPSGSVKYEDLVRDSDLFWETLRSLLRFSGRTLKVPTVGGNDLDLHRLFIEVTSRGGIERVIKDRKWKEVIGAFNFPTTITSASFVLRKYYLKLLYQLEQMYYLLKPVSSISSTDEAMRSLVNVSPNTEEGNHELNAGCSVYGIIDGKFDNGYLVTMRVGSEELKGVLYHIPQTPCPPLNLETSSAIPSKRHKKRSRLAMVDSQRPKCHRSGYNFFFSEQYARLKLEYQGQERALTKKIGHMWSNLSESEKQVYQEKGVKDVERYRTEMLEYRSSYEATAAAAQ
ncbi:PREDICTED: high mobility group B protein 10 [Tarenaya hassleriana]|uniref:high mobility group B protein 10 n=1 Tax=Tarenaya hassleriana TaxID=28532 RepID=UPI00053CA707|nr:PREDICTED: high mobility group B protein 10 [Tarenaya hassleriana]